MKIDTPPFDFFRFLFNFNFILINNIQIELHKHYNNILFVQ